MRKVFILTTTYNRLAFTRRCLNNLEKQDYKNFQIIVIDGGSTDGTQEFIEKHHQKVILIQGPTNNTWWWTKCMYEGVELSLRLSKPGDFVLALNDDCFVKRDYLSQILVTAKKHPKALISSLCVRAEAPSQVVEAGIRIDWPTGLVYGVAQTISSNLGYYKNMQVVNNLDALPGKGTLIPIEVFKRIGNYDVERLPHYIADYEFANRAKRAGFDLLVATNAIIKHHFEATGNSFKRSQKIISYKRVWDLLFGRKSMNNIVDWVTFLFLVCPKQFLIRNLYFSFWKIMRAVFCIYPFYHLRPVIRFFLQICYHLHHLIVHRIGLAVYRLWLKIIQFPKYHLRFLAQE